MPQGKLTKRHNALSYHKTRWAIAAKILWFNHIKGEDNPADILSKHWDMPSVWKNLKPLMFHRFKESDTSSDNGESSPDNGEHKDSEAKV